MSRPGLDRRAPVLALIKDIPTLPTIALELSQMVDAPTSSIADVGAIIAKDAGLTARVLRLANSSFYGFSRRIGTLTEAVIILGFNTIKSLVFAASARSLFRADAGDGVMGELWKHSLCTATLAQAGALLLLQRYRG